MVEAIIALIAGIVALIPLILSARKIRKDNRNALAQVECAELDREMDAVDAASQRVQPPPGQT